MKLLLLFLGALLKFCSSEVHAVMWAGIYPWEALAYSAEAHIYQTYHQLIEYGVNPNNIITLGMDSVAFDERNPNQGDVHTYPDGPNVYTGFNFDYVHWNNTPEVLMKVLKGEETDCGTKRVLNSTEDDDLFIVSFQHGAPGAFIFMYNSEDYKLFSDSDLLKTLKTMKEKKMFRNIIFYTTACHSGSMFFKIPEDIGGWYALTSAPPSSDAYACDLEQNIFLNSCFGKAWQNYTRICRDQGELFEKTISDQYMWSYDRRCTKSIWCPTKEEYCEYGDKSLKDKFIGAFQSNLKNEESENSEEEEFFEKNLQNSDERESISSIVSKKFGNKNLEKIKERFSKNEEEENYDPKTCTEEPSLHTLEYLEILKGKIQNSCYSKLVGIFQKQCGELGLFDYKNTLVFGDICKEGLIEEFKSYMKEIC